MRLAWPLLGWAFPLLVASCGPAPQEATADDCLCLLDELFDEITLLDSVNSHTGRLVRWSVDPRVSVLIKKIAPVEIDLKFRYENARDQEAVSVERKRYKTTYSPELMGKYRTARALFCARSRVYCGDTSIPDSVKTRFYLEELTKLEELLLMTDSTDSSPASPSETPSPRPIRPAVEESGGETYSVRLLVDAAPRAGAIFVNGQVAEVLVDGPTVKKIRIAALGKTYLFAIVIGQDTCRVSRHVLEDDEQIPIYCP